MFENPTLDTFEADNRGALTRTVLFLIIAKSGRCVPSNDRPISTVFAATNLLEVADPRVYFYR